MSFGPDSIKTLASIAQILQKARPEENPLAHIVAMVRQQMQVDVCSLYLLQDKTLILVATDGLDPSSVGRVRMGLHEGLTGLAVEKLQPVIVNEASRHPRFKYFPETGEEKFHSFAAIPLLDHDKVVGALTIQTRLLRDFKPQEIEILKLIAFQLTGVIHNLVALEILRVEEPGGKTPGELKGIAAAPGFGVGPAFFILPGITPVILPRAGKKSKSPVSAKGIQGEWKKLEAAIRKTSVDLLRLEGRLQKKFSKHEADIFYSHRMILSDRSFLKKLKVEIQKGKAALEASGHVIGEYIQEFEKIEDPHFRERSADLEDLRQRIMDHLLGSTPRKEKESWEGILVAETLVPSDTVRLDPERIRGILTERGGLTSHAAILARSMGIPAVMGIPGITTRIQPGDLVIVDGNIGRVFVNPRHEVLQEYERIQEKFADQIVQTQPLAGTPAVTQDGRRIHLEANVGLYGGVSRLFQFGAEGIGLYRTEFPFMIRKHLPSEEEQFHIYRKIVEEAHGLPITFRTLDAGGDKPIESLGLVKEANPFLGYRSIRLSLSQPEILRTQFRALLRTSNFGRIRLLIPMISGMEEILAVKKIFEEEKKVLDERGAAFNPNVPLGMMIEVPSAVRMAELLIREVDFFSIGTNDLIQYTLAVDRNNEKVASFFEPLHPAVLSSIAHVAEVGHTAGKPVGVCGEMAGDPMMAPLLVGLGITQLSMIPSNIPLVKNIIRRIRYDQARDMAQKAIKSGTVDQVRTFLETLAPPSEGFKPLTVSDSPISC